MQKTHLRSIVVLAAVTAAGACGGGGGDDAISTPTATSELISTEEMADLSLSSGELSESSLEDEVESMQQSGVRRRRFTRSRPCTGGGDVTVRGVLTLTITGNTVEAEGDGIRTENGCTFEAPRGTVTLDGRAQWDARLRRVGGQPRGPQTEHWTGRTTFARSDGSERTCRVDLTLTRYPESGRRTLEGTICGQPVGRGSG